MFFKQTLTHELSLHPKYFCRNIKKVIQKKLYQEVEGKVNGRYGHIIIILSVDDVGKGQIDDRNGSASFNVKYTAVVFRPFRNEVIDGIIKEVSNLGMLVEIGPTQCFISKRSIPDMEYNPNLRPPGYSTSDESEILAAGDEIRVKVTGVRMDTSSTRATGKLYKEGR